MKLLNELPPFSALLAIVGVADGNATDGLTPSGIISLDPVAGDLPSRPLKFSIRLALLWYLLANAQASSPS